MFSILTGPKKLKNMPTIGAHVSEAEEQAVKIAAAASPEKKPSPYAAEAIRQRLSREGLLPGTKEEEVARITAKVAAAVREDPSAVQRVEAVLNKQTRRRMVPA